MRFLSSDEGQTIVRDMIRGAVTFENQQLDDLIIQRSDGLPTYNFAVVVDDVTMQITHVIRGDDHLNNTPRQIQLYQAFGYEPPQFAHLPMILGSDKTKLSKRHGATAVTEYIDLGYLPEALVNYLSRLGWSSGDQEIFSPQELIEKFSLDNVGKAPSVFNPEKLLWLNHHYIQQADPGRLAALVLDLLKKDGICEGGAGHGVVQKAREDPDGAQPYARGNEDRRRSFSRGRDHDGRESTSQTPDAGRGSASLRTCRPSQGGRSLYAR